MTPHLLFFATLALAAFLFAKVEIHSEGADGWAARFPTWRLDNRWTRLVMSGRPLTGYHLHLLLALAVLVHAAFGLGLAAWTPAVEARVLAFLILFWVLEDFLWFCLNPHFGLRRFRRSEIWWHAPSWWWIMPRDYWLGVPAGLALYAVSSSCTTGC